MTARNLFAWLFLALAATAAPALAQDGPADAEPDIPPFNASAGNQEARLDRLFDRLATAETPEDAKRFEASIDAIWSQSGSPTADLLTARAIDLVGENQDGALKLLDAALEAKPDYAEGWNKRATLFFLRGDYPSAMSAIHETLELEPRHYGAWAGLGKILEQSGDDRKALAAYRRALAIHPYIDGLKEEADELEIKLKGEEM
jgi:tetratricopeptide (TPR) repeat protein